MNRTKKVLISIIIDFLLLGLVVAAVFFLVKGELDNRMRNILTWGIVLCIPAGFGITCWNVIGDKYDDMRDPYLEEEDKEEECEKENDKE